VLSHVSVRARNEKVLFATVFDTTVFASLKARSSFCETFVDARCVYIALI
jgi:hypothetical protein